jgi:hypothetical protein
MRFEEITNCKSPSPCSSSRKSFKCTKLCDFYKNKWEGSNMSMCDYVHMNLVQLGHDKTVRDLTAKGHSVGYYEAPG